MKKAFLAVFMALTLTVIVPLQSCSTAWITTFDNILVAAAPALINILNIIAIAEGKPIDTALEAKITADAALLKKDAADFAAASAAAAPTACAQLQAAVETYSADQADVLELAQVLDPKSPEAVKIETLSALVAGTVVAITAVIPSCQVASGKFESAAVPVPLKGFVDNYNMELVRSTGNPNVDNFTKKHKIHVHSKFVRVITFGQSY